MAERALLRKCSPKGGVQRFQAERNAAGALAEQKQAAQMEPEGRSAALSGRAK